MYKQEINNQMEKWQVKNPNQLAKLAGIDYRTAVKATSTNEYMSPISIAKIAKVFGFKGYVDFRQHTMQQCINQDA